MSQLIPRIEHDGCSCPPGVMRCVHFNERVLVMGFCDEAQQRHAIHHHRNVPRFCVGIIEGWDTCAECGAPIAIGGLALSNPQTEREALVAFYAAEQQFCRGDADE